MNIILLGAQGSGKGTQAQLLKEKYNLIHVSTGDLLRETTDEKIKQQMKEGKLISDEQIIKLIKEKLSGEEGAILDGFPRTLGQAEALDEITHIDGVIELKLTDEEALKRLSGRKTCKNCKTVYGTENPSKKQGKCDKCTGELYQREDDKPEAIKKRLTAYHEETEPLIEYYKPRKIVHTVDASKSIKEIFANLCKIIEELA